MSKKELKKHYGKQGLVCQNVDREKYIVSVLKKNHDNEGDHQKILKHQHRKDDETLSITHHYYTDTENNKVISFIDRRDTKIL